MRALNSVLSVSVLLPFTSLSAQEQPPIEPGSRVRVSAPDLAMHRQVATLEAWRGDTLVLARPWTMDCPLASVTRLEVSQYRKSNCGKGALIGGGIGVAVGALIGAMWTEEGDLGCTDRAACVGLGAAALGVTGGLIGLGIGALSKTERWEEVPLDQLRASLAPPHDRRLGIGLSVAFCPLGYCG